MPDKYILLTQCYQLVLRVDAFYSSEESFAFNDSVIWYGFLIIGWGDYIYLIYMGFKAEVNNALNSYFGYLYTLMRIFHITKLI
jgi:hypothetical protein